MGSQISGNWESTWDFVCLSILSSKFHVQVANLPPFPPWFLLLAHPFILEENQSECFTRTLYFSTLIHHLHHIIWFSQIPWSYIISVGFLIISCLWVYESKTTWRKDGRLSSVLHMTMVMHKRGHCSLNAKSLTVSLGNFQDKNLRRDSAEVLVWNISGLLYLRLVRSQCVSEVLFKFYLGALLPISCQRSGSC